MGTGAKVGITIGALFLGLIGFLIATYFSYSNQAVEYETRIEAKQQDNKQILGQYRIKIQEMAQVPGMQADDFEQVYVKAINARYSNGMGEMMAWIKEQNPQLGTEVYTNIQTEMASGREKFSQNQTQLADICRGFQQLMRKPYSGFWVRIAGYPSNEYENNGGKELCRLVTSAGAEEAFKTGIETPVKLR